MFWGCGWLKQGREKEFPSSERAKRSSDLRCVYRDHGSFTLGSSLDLRKGDAHYGLNFGLFRVLTWNASDLLPLVSFVDWFFFPLLQGKGFWMLSSASLLILHSTSYSSSAPISDVILQYWLHVHHKGPLWSWTDDTSCLSTTWRDVEHGERKLACPKKHFQGCCLE